MSGNSFILPSIVAVIVFLLLMAGMQFVGAKENIRARMRRMAIFKPPALEEEKKESEFANALEVEEEPSDFGEACNQIVRVFVDMEAFRKSSRLRFYRAGITSQYAPSYYLLFKYALSPVLLAIALWLVTSHAEGINQLIHYILTGFLVIVGIFGADLYIKNSRDKREQKLRRSFPDALDLLLVCVESGLALDGALARVCKELGMAYPEITDELNRTRLELTLLNDRAQALGNLAERTDMLPFRTLVTTLLQSERFGTSLTDTLRVLSEDSRNTRLMLAEEKAGRLPALMTIPLILFMIPALFIIILGPAIITSLNNIKSI